MKLNEETVPFLAPSRHVGYILDFRHQSETPLARERSTFQEPYIVLKPV